MLVFKRIPLALLLSGLLSGGGTAADFSDPTWPCIQRKVDGLSLGLMWQFPVPEALPDDSQTQQDIADLADALMLRRLELETMRPAVAAFQEKYGNNPDLLGHVFSRTFAALTKRRSRIINGIGDFSLSQIALAENIDLLRLEMDDLLDAAEPDYDKIDVLEERIDWDQVIYTDRQRSITYLCETPQIIEKRLFAVARLLAEGL